MLETRARCDATLLALLRSAVIWRVAAAEDRALARWAAEQGAATRVLGKRLRAIALCTPVVAAAPAFVLAVFTATVYLVPDARLAPGSGTAPGTFLTLYAAVTQVTIAMLALTGQFVTLSELGPTMSRLRPLADQGLEREVPGIHPGPLAGQVGISAVVFGYRKDRPPLFDGLSLSVAPGEFVAIVGPSGAGKSTILRLLLGFAEPWQGTVTFDGRDLAGLDPAAVRRQLGVVLQSSEPLGQTVRECVAGPRTIGDERIWDLLEQAGLASEVHALPGGLDCDLGPGASRLSGGQRQRLSIAAALAGDPAVLLFDEATSALDNITQATVMRTVLSSRATRIVIAHRLSTVRHADRVLVVAGGRVVESGPPDELMAAGGLFARLAARQEA